MAYSRCLQQFTEYIATQQSEFPLLMENNGESENITGKSKKLSWMEFCLHAKCYDIIICCKTLKKEEKFSPAMLNQGSNDFFSRKR